MRDSGHALATILLIIVTTVVFRKKKEEKKHTNKEYVRQQRAVTSIVNSWQVPNQMRYKLVCIYFLCIYISVMIVPQK